MSRRMLVVRNPKAGSFLSQNLFLEAAGVIFGSDYNAYVYSTTGRGDATRVVVEEGANYDIIVAFGGDGTLHEVINGLMQLAVRPLLGYIPAGTTNDFAAGLGLSRNIVKAAGAVIDGVPVELDVGRFGDGQYFSYVASFGSFAKVSFSAQQDMKNLIGYAAYLLEGVKALSDLRACHMVVETDGVRTEGDFIFGAVSNAMSVGGIMKFSVDEVDLRDGLFEVLLIRDPKNLAGLQKLLHDVAMRHYSSSAFLYCKAAHVSISADEKLVWTLDGEDGGEHTAVQMDNCCRAIRILC